MTGWTRDDTRQYYCKSCRTFTDWEFRHISADTEDERCTKCVGPQLGGIPGLTEAEVAAYSAAMAGTIGVMSKPPMKRRSFHVSDELWNRAITLSGERNENVSDILRAALEAYVSLGVADNQKPSEGV